MCKTNKMGNSESLHKANELKVNTPESKLTESKLITSTNESLNKYFDLVYETDLLIHGLYDLKSSTKIDDVKTVFDEIIMDETIHYHATSACSAISILMNGFKDQQEVEKLNIKTTDQYLGSGIYFSENIEKTLQYGTYVFIAKLTKNDPFIINHMEHLNFCEYRYKNYDLIQSKKCVVYNGMYDRFGNLNFKEGDENGGVKDFFTEVRLKDSKDVNLLYLLVLKDYPDEKERTRQILADLGACVLFREISCILDFNDGKIYSTLYFPDTSKLKNKWSMMPSFEQIIQILKNETNVFPSQEFRQGITGYGEDSIVFVGTLYEYNEEGIPQTNKNSITNSSPSLKTSFFKPIDKTSILKPTTILKLKLEYMVFFR